MVWKDQKGAQHAVQSGVFFHITALCTTSPMRTDRGSWQRMLCGYLIPVLTLSPGPMPLLPAAPLAGDCVASFQHVRQLTVAQLLGAQVHFSGFALWPEFGSTVHEGPPSAHGSDCSTALRRLGSVCSWGSLCALECCPVTCGQATGSL